MKRIRLILGVTAFLVAILLGVGTVAMLKGASAAVVQDSTSERITRPRKPYSGFEIDVLVNGRPVNRILRTRAQLC